MITTRESPDRAVGTQLQSLRIFAGLNLENAAQRLGIRLATLAAVEEGRARPSAATVFAMAENYGVAPSRVFEIAAGLPRQA